VELADGIDRARSPQRQRSHVEHRPAAVVEGAEGQETIPVVAERPPGAGQVGFHEVEREGVVARGDRRVRGEDGGFAHSASARSKLSPPSRASRIRCSETKAACPSLRCQTAGVTPTA